MALKTFNLDEDTYERYSRYCKKEGISMSKQIQKFISEEVARLTASPSPHQALMHKDHDHAMRRFC